ncbi:hypothetical protein ACIQ6Y_15340 [Streptomyces sp. NPDC096205]|uniref:hypothetical protein n=1 Tax=Streptomyces sp. NPDC096205 TaxID=3366081 RepID=UPI0037FCE497
MPSSARILGIATAALVLAGGGFAVGRLTAPVEESRASQCAEPRQLYRETIDQIDPGTSEQATEVRANGRMIANTILQNPNCFSASDRATAQTILDSINDGVQQDAVNQLREDMEECVADATDEYSWSNC